jgi:large subunit ribosomal protein L19
MSDEKEVKKATEGSPERPKGVEGTEKVEEKASDAPVQEEPQKEEVKAADATEASEEPASDTPSDEKTEDTVVELPHRDLRPGMVVRIHERIKDVNTKGEERERVQIFEGVIIGIKSAGVARTMTIRKNSHGWIVEKIFPLSSPNVTKVEVVKTYRVRRAKLNYLRGTFKRKMREIK